MKLFSSRASSSSAFPTARTYWARYSSCLRRCSGVGSFTGGPSASRASASCACARRSFSCSSLVLRRYAGSPRRWTAADVVADEWVVDVLPRTISCRGAAATDEISTEQASASRASSAEPRPSRVRDSFTGRELRARTDLRRPRARLETWTSSSGMPLNQDGASLPIESWRIVAARGAHARFVDVAVPSAVAPFPSTVATPAGRREPVRWARHLGDRRSATDSRAVVRRARRSARTIARIRQCGCRLRCSR